MESSKTRDRIRDEARRLYGREGLTVGDHAEVQISHLGVAFVTAILTVPAAVGEMPEGEAHD